MNLCYLMADGIHRRRARRSPTSIAPRNKDDGAYWAWQQQSSRQYFEKFFDLETRLRDADVIDIGCGLGGRTCYLAAKGVRHIVGTDINHAEIDRARQLATQLGDDVIREKVSFRKVTENEEAKDNGQFDVALLIDSLEHVRDPLATLNLAYSMLKPGGVFISSTAVLGKSGLLKLVLKPGAALGLIPKIQFIAQDQLEDELTECGFTLKEKQSPSSKFGAVFLIGVKT